MRFGFTGTQSGMSHAQLERLGVVLRDASCLDHGDCVGADAQAHVLARGLGLRVVGHPPEDPKKRAFMKCDESWPEKPYIIRNHDIVTVCEVLVATPGEKQEVLRSGTWATIRYARRIGRRHCIIFPDGTHAVVA